MRKLKFEQLELRQLLAGDLGSYLDEVKYPGPIEHSLFSTNPTNSKLASLKINNAEGFIEAGYNYRFRVTALNQNNQPLFPKLQWSASGGTINSQGLFKASEPGEYTITVTGVRGSVSITSSATVKVNETRYLNSIEIIEEDQVLEFGQQFQFSAITKDQYGNPISRTISWSTNKNYGSITSEGLFTASSTEYLTSVRARASWRGTSLSDTVFVKIQKPSESQILTSLAINESNVSVENKESYQFSATALDQNGQTISSASFAWSVSGGGSITSSGLFVSDGEHGFFTVTATAEHNGITLSASKEFEVSRPDGKPIFNVLEIENLVDSFYADLFLDRSEVVEILKFPGLDSVVSGPELNDLRIIATNSYYIMPEHIRALAHSVTHSNPANLKFKGLTNGNLAEGSSSQILYNLIDEWFFGKDEPTPIGTNVTYVNASGNVFNGPLSFSQAKQGYVGDCYLIASMISIGDKNPEKIYSMFIDNGDNTYTIRWFSGGIARYVTINSRLPVNTSNKLQYAGLGQNALDGTAILWAAFLEKAYAQFNETGWAGRNGTNTYSGIEGGWMHNTNAQMLGYSSNNYFFSSSSESQLRAELDSGKAVTVGTNGSVSSGWVGGHAYYVKSYDPNTGIYSLINPWGYNHVSATWSQLVSNCILFTSTIAA